MPDLADGESTQVQGSGRTPYTLKNDGGVYSCTCPAWQYQPLPIEKRSCKHLRGLRGDDAETERVGAATSRVPRRSGGAAGAGGSSSSTSVASSKTTAPKLLLAHRYSADIDISGWWMSEKLDGVRAFWDGEQFISRLGNVYLAPDWFTAQFPSTPLDGELFGGRGAFQKTVSIVRRSDRSDDWDDLQFSVFDAPALTSEGGTPLPFEERVEAVRDLLDACASEYIEPVDHHPCNDAEHLQVALQRVEEEGAEGIMLRQPGSPYQVGRSWTLLKVKSFFDTEGKVVGHIEGTGRHMGRLGALMVELKNGTKFKVGTGFSDAQREDPPKIGSLITFRYQELTDGGVPRFPSFIGERHDLSWEDIDDAPRRNSPVDASVGSLRKLQVPAAGQAPVVTKSTPRVAPKKEPEPEVEAAGNIYLEFQKGASVRFWEIEWDATLVYIEYGRVDKEPKTDSKTFATNLEARRFVDKQIKAKIEKGYVDEI